MGTAKYRLADGQGGKRPSIFARDKPLSLHWRANRFDWLADLRQLPEAANDRQHEVLLAILFDAAMQHVGAGRKLRIEDMVSPKSSTSSLTFGA